MAQLKDSIVQGNLRVTDKTLTDTLQATKIEVPTTSGGTTYGVGTSGQVIKSNGTTVYWANDNNSGDVTGPSSATVNDIATFNNANGKVIKDSGYTFSTGSTDTTATHVVLCNDSRLSNARTPSSHTHGNIQNGGTLQTNDITIASGDKLVVTDSSDSSKVARTSISFDGSTATKCLTQKGTWESFTNNDGTVTSITLNANSPITVDNTSAITTSGTRTFSHATSGATAGSYGDSSAQTPDFGDTFKVPYVTVNDTGHVTGISEHTVTIPEITQTGIYPVIGTQTASTGAWKGYLHNVATLYDGLTIMYYLPYAGSGNATLELTLDNGTSTGAIDCYYSTSRLTTHYGKGCNIIMTYWGAGSISIDGTATTNNRWIANACYDSDYNAYQVRRNYVYFKAGPNKIFPYTLIMQLPDGRWESIVTSNSSGTGKARNTHGFVLGQLFWMYSNSTYTENDSLGQSQNVYDYSSQLVDHRYSFNTANNATYGTVSYKPIYLVGAIGSDGLFYLDETWWTQTLPTTEDGKLYMYIGDAFDYYRMIFALRKPIYHYVNGALRQYAQDASTVNGFSVGKSVPSDAVFTDTTYSLSQHPTYLNTLVYTTTQSGGSSSTSTIEIPTIVRGTMDNDSSTSTAFVVSASNTITSLYDGLTFIIKNTKVASAANCTLNINNLGAKRIWCSQSNGYCTTHWGLNQTYLFVYDSTNDRFELQQGRDTDSTDVSTYRPKSTKTYIGGNGLKAYSLYAKLRGTASATTSSVTVNLDSYSSFTTNSGTGTKTYGTQVFDFTKLYFFDWDGDNAPNTYAGNNGRTYAVSGIDLRYTLNITTTTLTINSPLYLVFYATGDFETKYGQIANAVNSGYPVYTQDIGATLTAIHNDSTLEANISRIRFVYVGTPYSKYQVELDLFNHVYMPNPTVSNANKWKSAPILANGAVSYNADCAVNDSNGNKITDTYVTSDNYCTITQDSSDGHKLNIVYITSTPTGGASSTSSITIPDNNTTYSMSRDGASVKLTPSSGSAQSVSLSDLITGLSVGTTTSKMNDYLIAQYSGGGSSNNTYYRRKLSTVMGDFIYAKGSTGTIPGGTICNGYVTGGSGNMEIIVPLPKMIDPAVTTITLNKFPINSRYSGGYYFPNSYQSNGYDVISNDPGSGFEIVLSRSVGTNLDIKIHGNLYTGVPCASGNNIPVVVRLESDVTVTFS